MKTVLTKTMAKKNWRKSPIERMRAKTNRIPIINLDDVCLKCSWGHFKFNSIKRKPSNLHIFFLFFFSRIFNFVFAASAHSVCGTWFTFEIIFFSCLHIRESFVKEIDEYISFPFISVSSKSILLNDGVRSSDFKQ